MAPIARRVRQEAGVPVAVGWMIDAPADADRLIRDEQADLFIPARAVLAEPHWPYRAAQELGLAAPHDVLPPQYAAWLKRRIVTRDAA
jgi:2,4-dienoyl-CoA reductase-like NADH-dependent reductase (Old Yellow Enzyme family)